MKIKRALISVSDKTYITNFARELSNLGVELIATSGTLKELKKNGIRYVKPVSELTNFPEILGGRVKTIHPKLVGSILAQRDRKDHQNELKKLEITPIDMVICDLYPAEKAINRGENLKTVLDEIDIGGATLIRAAAKNFENVVVIPSSTMYNRVLNELKKKGDVSIKTRHLLAIEAFRKTARYDHSICRFLKKELQHN